MFPTKFLFFFFFKSPCHHRDLPSFPTRRSSDLDAPQLLAQFVRDDDSIELGVAVHDRLDGIDVMRDQVRSEEHTSELQSLRHLVCRLLLEKKKNEIWQKT